MRADACSSHSCSWWWQPGIRRPWVVLGPIAAVIGAGEGPSLPALSPRIVPGPIRVHVAEQLQAGGRHRHRSAATQIEVAARRPVIGGLLAAVAGACPGVRRSTRCSSRHLGPGTRAVAHAIRHGGSDGGAFEIRAPAPGIWELLRICRRRFSRSTLAAHRRWRISPSAGTFKVALPALAHANYGAGEATAR